MTSNGSERLPLDGVLVIDFSMHAAGPFAGFMLASLGANVIKVESRARLDITRRHHSMYGKPPSSFEQVNANKLSVCLNLKEPRAVELALGLVKAGDMVLENMRPGVMNRLGLGFERMREVKPEIIVVSVTLNGQNGPDKSYVGYAPIFGATGGLGELTGYPDAPPVELRHAMDHTVGMMAAFCAVSALGARNGVEGGGQHIDVAARDVATSFTGAALMEYAMNGRERGRMGNRDDSMAPHGVYRCEGEDAWVSIAVGSDEEWQALVRALDNPPWTRAHEFGDAYRRWMNQDELNQHLEQWTIHFTPEEVALRLQGAGVAAMPSMSAAQLVRDPHLAARNAFPTVVHAEKGSQRAVTPPWRFSRTPARINKWTPSLGENNVEVFSGLLGLEEKEVAALEEAKVIW